MEYLTDPKYLALAGLVYAALSEIIGINKKLKSNSIIQILMVIIKRIIKK
jgi:hypothetical protein